ncbi:unnamed protein product [Trifolium pratense]|uniref:Uncharacterized protein n=1 Tax=Trifolium pratense TaxID=57577 RepID=A0ACB0ITW2_TRIPR|nr:unnamed protein product [Trifolium pratense]
MANEEIIGNSSVGATERPFKFEGNHFKRWQQKMFFFLTLKKCAYVLKQPIPVVPAEASASASGTNEQTVNTNGDAVSAEKDKGKATAEQLKEKALQLEIDRQLWIDNDYVCKNYIINGLEDDLYDYYRTYNTASDVWEALSKKYDTEEAGVKKYAVSRYLKYQMVDERSVEVQSHELQKIAHEIITEGMPLHEQFQISVIIDKLPPSWKDFKNQLRHKTKEFSIEGLITRLRIEEESRKQDMKEEEKILVVSNTNKKKFGAALKPTGKPLKNQNQSRVQNRVKNGNPVRGHIAKQHQQQPPPRNDAVEPFYCFNCWKTGHISKKCRNPKRPKPANLAHINVNVADEPYAAMITEINMVGGTDGWWIDTGATRHVCYDRAMFKTYTNAENKKVQMGNAHTSDVAGVGDVVLKFTSGKTLILKEVLHVPEMKKNLVSGFLLNKAGFNQTIGADMYTITKNGIFIGKGYASDGMFKLNVDFNVMNKISPSVYSLCDFNIWHSRLCHVNKRSILNISNLGLIPKLSFNDIEKCEFCSQAKITKSKHKSVIRESEPMDLIHSDICELDGTMTRNNKRYFITFIDDCSDYTFVYLMKNKSDAFDMFKIFVKEIENQFNTKIKRLRSDRGTEYNSSLFNDFYKQHGIIHETTAPYSPEMNGKAERKNRTLTELVVAIMLNYDAAKHWWGEIILTVCFVLNRIPKSKRSESAYEILKKRQPNLSYLRTWGCLAYVRKPDPKRVKLASRAYECVFIGYAANSKAYRFFDLNEKVIIESNDADFYENKFPFKSRNSGGTEQDNIPESSHLPVIPNDDSNDEVENELRRSKRVRVAKDYGPDYATFTLNEDPANLQEALSSMDADLWQEAINDEMDSLESNKTWHLVDLPPGCKPIGCKWILKKKLKPDGTVEKYKARLVAKGFRQRENIDFFDTFSPVTRITSIRVLISIAAIYNLIVHQMDVKTAFLNGDLEEEIYMEQPEGFVIHGQETKVCKLDKSLYGLKQAPKQWHEKFDNLMILNGFRLNESDKCIYYKSDDNICTIICLYVDDMLIFGSNLSAINDVKSLFSNNFDMKDLGEASVILGIKITRSEKGISLDQSHYVEKILKKYGYFNCKPGCTPYDPSVKLFKNTGDSVRQTEYASIIGSLRYATDCTRPDIAYVVGLLCRFTSRPSDEHWHAIERVMRYLKRTMNLGLHYQRFPAVLEGYSDADWNTLSDDSKATSGFIFSIAGGAVSWKSKKQTILAQSTMESEMIALATASEEASWLRCLLSEIPLWEKPMPAVLIHCDSTAAIAKIENRFYNGKRRQIRRKHSTVRELITTGAVRVDHTVNTNGDAVSAEKDKGKATAEQLKEKALQLEIDRQLWIDNDYVCKNYIINGLEDDLYDYYRTYNTASDVWEALSKKYDTEEAGVKKYAVSRYLKYQMVDERSVEVQSHELQKIAHEIITEGMPLHEQFQISVIIDKLPPSWKDFKNQLRHKTKEFSIEGLITRLRIEEESRKQDMKEEEKILVVSNTNKKKFGAALKPTGKPLKNQNQSRVQNRVKNGNPVRGHIAKQHQQQPPPRNDAVEPFYCFNCWKTGHISKKCRNPKRPKPANLAHINVNVADEPYAAMITEINMVGGTDGWWIDTGATRHVCYDRAMFKTYTNAENKKVQMGNAHTSDVAGVGDVVLKFTSGKTLILKEVLHDNIPESSHLPVIPNDDSNDEVENELRRSKRVRVAKDYGPDYATFTLNEDPANLQEALSSMDADLWQEAINDEMDSLESNKTWHLVDLPPGCKPIGCKWILKKKLKPDGTVEKYKARLVAKGFRQRENIDFFDTFSPVTRITSIRVLISIAAIYNLIVHQMDVKTAFLNGDLEEEIYMEQPEEFVIHGQETKVCKLDKSLYGLKQAPKQWHEKFDNLMILNGFRLNESDKCIYYKSDDNICTIICLYVDDMLIFGSNLSAINDVKSLFSNNFDMKDLGEASVILGIKITRSEKGISLDQSHYVEKILKKYGYFNCKPGCTPYDPSVKLFKNTGDSVRQTEYASIIGSLRYATDCTRPDIAYVVGLLCRFTSRPSDEHWHAIERVMRYLKRTMNLGLHYQRFPAVLEGYSDADWNTLSDDSKATSGFIFSIASGAVSWKSKKQTILAQSTMESEMIALATASEEASWLRCLLSEIPLWEKPMPAVLIHCDSTAAIAKIENRFL